MSVTPTLFALFAGFCHLSCQETVNNCKITTFKQLPQNCHRHAKYYKHIVEANSARCLSFYMIKIQLIQVFLGSNC